MGRRTWTDIQLRGAVTSQTSWRGVLRQLGLKATSGGSINVVKRRAEELALDTSHFTHSRRWSDQELEEAVRAASSWPDVADRLGLVKDRRTGYRLKGHAIRLGIDVSHLEEDPHLPASTDHLDLPAQLSELRNAAPSVAAAWFILRGLPVAVPAEPQEYDLLVTAPTGILRVQVKSTTCRSPNDKWQVCIGRRPYSSDRSASKIPYNPESLDYFVVINGVGHLYLIPIRILAGLTAIYLSAYEAYRVGDVSSLLEPV